MTFFLSLNKITCVSCFIYSVYLSDVLRERYQCGHWNTYILWRSPYFWYNSCELFFLDKNSLFFKLLVSLRVITQASVDYTLLTAVSSKLHITHSRVSSHAAPHYLQPCVFPALHYSQPCVFKAPHYSQPYVFKAPHYSQQCVFPAPHYS